MINLRKNIELESWASGSSWLSDNISKHYPLTKAQLGKYFEVLNPHLLSQNKYLPWSDELIDKFSNNNHWKNLLQNEGILWNDKLVARHTNHIIPNRINDLLNNKFFFITDSFLKNYKENLDWDLVSERTDIHWSIQLIDNYSDYWNWYRLGMNNSFPWSEDLIERYKAKLAIARVRMRFTLPQIYRIIDKHIDRLDWGSLSSNTSIPWHEELIDRYFGRWNWDSLSYNKTVHKLVPTFFEKYPEKINWSFLVPGVPKEQIIDFFYKYEYDIHWRVVTMNDDFDLPSDIIIRQKQECN